MSNLTDEKLARPRYGPAVDAGAAGECAGSAKRRPHILLYGGFGIGNTGNDATLEVALAGLRERLPDAQFTVVAPMPEAVAAEFDVASVPIDAPASPRPRWIAPAFKPFNEIGRWLQTRRLMKTVDCLVVPGTGIFDDLVVTARQHAYPLWRWCALARRAGVNVMFVSVGAGPVKRAPSRRLFAWAAALADRRSYRDEASRDFVREILRVDTSEDIITPDLVFGLDVAAPPLRPAGKRVIGVGVMDYHTWSGEKGTPDDIYDQYMAKLSDICLDLLRKGHALNILVGDIGDAPAADDLRDRLAKAAPDRKDDVVATHARSLRDLCGAIGKTDAVAATRYHTVVGALMCGRPAISLGYAEKNRAVMTDFELGPYCHDIWDFDSTKVQTQLSELLSDLPARGDRLRRSVDRLREAVSIHMDSIAAAIGGPQGS
jgi:polysaccharide pyruvyl transferase WcaK-like protein